MSQWYVQCSIIICSTKRTVFLTPNPPTILKSSAHIWGWKSHTIPSEFPYKSEHQCGKCCSLTDISAERMCVLLAEHQFNKSHRARRKELVGEPMWASICVLWVCIQAAGGAIFSAVTAGQSSAAAWVSTGHGCSMHYHMGVATSSLPRKVFWSATEARKVPGMPVQDEGGKERNNKNNHQC